MYCYRTMRSMSTRHGQFVLKNGTRIKANFYFSLSHKHFYRFFFNDLYFRKYHTFEPKTDLELPLLTEC